LISFKNISRDPLNVSPDELMERFVRGSAARTGEGSGLGLNIAKSLIELQGGSLSLNVDGDLFRVDITLNESSY
jgi:signal transduction histidine kinase